MRTEFQRIDVVQQFIQPRYATNMVLPPQYGVVRLRLADANLALNSRMQEIERLVLNELRALGSYEAATYLMTQYGVECSHYFHRPLHLMLHCSWKRSDQVRLAHRFLLRRPFYDHIKALGDFASFMSLRLLIKLMREHVKMEILDLWTFRKYVELVLMSNAKSERDKALVSQLIAEYHQLRAAESNALRQ